MQVIYLEPANCKLSLVAGSSAAWNRGIKCSRFSVPIFRKWMSIICQVSCGSFTTTKTVNPWKWGCFRIVSKQAKASDPAQSKNTWCVIEYHDFSLYTGTFNEEKRACSCCTYCSVARISDIIGSPLASVTDLGRCCVGITGPTSILFNMSVRIKKRFSTRLRERSY